LRLAAHINHRPHLRVEAVNRRQERRGILNYLGLKEGSDRFPAGAGKADPYRLAGGLAGHALEGFERGSQRTPSGRERVQMHNPARLVEDG